VSWVEEELERLEELRAASAPEPSEQEIAAAVRDWWRWLGESLKRSVGQARELGAISAEVSEPFSNAYRVANSEAGLAAVIELDEQIRAARFDYSASNQGGNAPEGGVLTLRPRGRGRIATFFADRQLHEQELMRTLLKPVLFPDLPSDET
jgi:hypothetical protein